jgi:hypothetical protein
MKQLIYVSCASAQKYPEKPKYLLVRGKKYLVEKVEKTAKIQSINPPFETRFYYKIRLETENLVEIEYHEKKREWYLLDGEKFLENSI